MFLPDSNHPHVSSEMLMLYQEEESRQELSSVEKDGLPHWELVAIFFGPGRKERVGFTAWQERGFPLSSFSSLHFLSCAVSSVICINLEETAFVAQFRSVLSLSLAFRCLMKVFSDNQPWI